MAISSNIEEVSPTRRKLKISVPSTQVSQAFGHAVTEIQKTANVKGFRKGKVPPSMVRKFFAEDVYKKAFQSVVETGYDSALKSSQLFAVSQPQIEPEGEFKDSKDFAFTATIDINPQLDIQGYKDLTLKTSLKDVTDEDVNQAIERLSRDYGSVEKVEEARPIEKGDVAEANYDIKVDGQVIENGSAKGVRLDLGRPDLVSDFVTGIVGMKPEESRTFNVQYPEDYHVETLKGKTAEIDFTLLAISKMTPAEINDEFAKKLGAEDVENLKRSIRDNLSQNVERRRIDEFTEQIVDQLLAKNEFEVPESLVEKVIDQAIAEANSESPEKKLDPKNEDVRKDFRETATTHVRGILALGNVARTEGVSVEDKELAPELMDAARSYGMNINELLKRGGQQLVEEVRGRVLLNKTVKHLVGMSKVEHTS